MEAEIRAHDIIAQKARLRGLVDGHLQPLHRQGILGADVDIPLRAAGSRTGDHHALDHAVGVALHNALIHESAGVALVAVAHDVLHIGHIAPHALPLAPGREASAASSAEARVRDLRADLRVGHLKQRLLQCLIAAQRQIFLQILGVGLPGVLQDQPLLVLIEGNIVAVLIAHAVLLIEQALDDLAAEDGLVDDLVAVLRVDMGVEYVQRLDIHQRADLAEAVAAALFQVDALSPGLLPQ